MFAAAGDLFGASDCLGVGSPVIVAPSGENAVDPKAFGVGAIQCFGQLECPLTLTLSLAGEWDVLLGLLSPLGERIKVRAKAVLPKGLNCTRSGLTLCGRLL